MENDEWRIGNSEFSILNSKWKWAHKPDSVVGGHSSGMRVAARLMRPTRGSRSPEGEHRGGPPLSPYLALHRVGFAMTPPVAGEPVRSYRTFSPLPVLPEGNHRPCVFCGTFRRVAPPWCCQAPCPVVSGLSSTATHPPTPWRRQAVSQQRPPGPLPPGS
jgi:hypothetical protein